MASQIIASTVAPTSYIQLSNSNGLLILIPEAVVNTFRAKGTKYIDVGAVSIFGDDEPPPKSEPWVTLTEAARLHQTDSDGLELDAAKKRIRRACDDGDLLWRPEGRAVLIDPTSLGAWRLKQREKELGRIDELA